MEELVFQLKTILSFYEFKKDFRPIQKLLWLIFRHVADGIMFCKGLKYFVIYNKILNLHFLMHYTLNVFQFNVFLV